MSTSSKNKITLKIILSYLVLAILAVVSGFYIYSEIRVYLSTEVSAENDTKLLKTGSLLTHLYEAESMSKLALQTKSKASFTNYSQKIDSIIVDIDSLKQLTPSEEHKSLLDSVQILLIQKLENSNELWDLKAQNQPNSSIDSALREIQKMEASTGKLTVENFHKNPEKLSPYERKILEDWVALLNENVPKDAVENEDPRKVDSILEVSKTMLTQLKRKNVARQRSLEQKEIALNRNDLILSQQLRGIITGFEQEIVTNTYNDTIKKQAALRTSIRLAGFAAILSFLVVGLFTFLITRDFLKVQSYRQKLEQEKKFSESLLKSREQLISTVSHDLRTPLNTITGYSELMENTGLSEKQNGYLKNVRSASKYVDRLVNDLLDFSKLEAGKIKIEQIPFNLKSLLTETAENIREIHSKKPIELIIAIEDELEHTVLGDPFRIRQIVTNLISNAYKFTAQGFIKVSANYTYLSKNVFVASIIISDSGVGIPKEKQKLIFKEFTQAEQHTDKKFGGYGLGLTISKKLASLLKGTLHLKSEPTKGSSFTLKIPLEFTKKSTSLENRKAITPKAGLSILILDDDPSMLHLLKEVCLNEQIEAHTYSDFYAIPNDPFLRYDVVLTDIEMPTINGIQVLKKLKNAHYSHYKTQPIIAMTGRRDIMPETYKAAGFVSILQKPFTKTTFLKVLGELFGDTVLTGSIIPHHKNSISASSLFNLDLLISFIGNNSAGINEVLSTFMEDTNTNMILLEKAVLTKNEKMIHSVAHRMLPMFRQLNTKGIVPILEYLEHYSMEKEGGKSLKVHWKNLKQKTTVLQMALQAHLTKSPNYSD